MHSKLRLNKFYPHMSEQDLQAFYGHFLALEEMTKPEWKRFVDNGELLRTNISARWPGWNDLNQINLADFYRKLGFKKYLSVFFGTFGYQIQNLKLSKESVKRHLKDPNTSKKDRIPLRNPKGPVKRIKTDSHKYFTSVFFF